MNKKMRSILTIAIIITILAALGLLKFILSRQDAIPENDPTLVGNTAGNLYNGGYFAESNGEVYFANPYDNGNIYKMDVNEQNVTKIASANASFLNVAGDYLYYYSSTSGDQNGLGYVRNGRGFYRTKTDGSKTFTLAKGTTDSMMVIGNHMYFTLFEENTTPGATAAKVSVHRTGLSNEDDMEIIGEHIKLGGSNYSDIYYSGIDSDHCLYAYDTGTGSVRKILDNYVYLPIVDGSNVYFLDLKDDYKLKKYSFSDDSITLIVDERIDTYNVYNGTIVYQNVNPDGYALKKVNSDGSGVEIVKTGVYRDINITSAYIYFRDFNNSVPVYKTPTFGSVNVSTFDAAIVIPSK